jgi:nucleoside-diphosphate-sugar epimerase
MIYGKKLLVIGGSGFVGSHLVPAALRSGYHVTVLNRGSRRTSGAEQLTADRTSAEQLAQASRLSTAYDVVVDTSSYSLQNSKLAWKAFSRKSRHWIHLSTAAVYAETPTRYPSEDDAIGGAPAWGDYGINKSAADAYLLDQSSVTPVTVIRPPYIYGPRNDNDRETFIWSRCLRRHPVIVPNTGRTEIQFLHVADLAAAILAAASSPPNAHAIYNVAADERITLSHWVALTAKAGNFDDPGLSAGQAADPYASRQYFPFRDYPCCVDVRRVKSQLGWQARTNLADGLKETFLSYTTAHLLTSSRASVAETEILAKLASLSMPSQH